MTIPVEKQYDSQGAALYSQQIEEAPYTTHFLLPSLQAVWNLAKNPSLKLLDMGCGTGTVTRALKQVTGGIVLGVDLAEPMIQSALAIEAATKVGIQYCQGDCIQDMRELPMVAALAPFDYVNGSWLWSNSSTYEKLKGMASNAYNLLRKGGVVCGLIDSPFLTRKDYRLYERYGTFYSPEGTEDTLKDGQGLKATLILNPRLPPVELADTFWTPPTIERAFREVGFLEFKFIPPPYIYKTDNIHEANFYKALTHTPDFSIFTAAK